MPSRRVVTLRAFVVAIALGLIVASPGAAQGIRLEYTKTQGDKATYQMIMDGSTTVYVGDRTQKSSLKTEMFLTQFVSAVKDGVVSLNTKIDSGSINVNGQVSPIPMIGQEVTTDMKPNGEIINTQGFSGIDFKSMQLVFPDRELQINDTWESNLKETSQVPVPLNVTYKVIGLEKIKDQDCVKIASTVRSGKKSAIEGLSLDVKADGNIYFAYKTGKMMKNEVKSQMNMILKRVVNNEEQRIITKMEMDMRMELQY